MTEPIHIIRLGAGVQSSTMALMAACGEIAPMPVSGIFADTQAEPKSVYTWLDWLEKQLPFPVYRVTAGNIATDALRIRTSKKSGLRYLKSQIPLFTKDPKTGKIGMMGRKCTTDYKMFPLEKFARNMVRPKLNAWRRDKSPEKQPLIIKWIGVSTDEAMRMKDARHGWIRHIWPLIDKGMTRQDCLKWMSQKGYPKPSKSSCMFCPYHSDTMWRSLDSESMAFAIKWEQDYQRASEMDQVTIGKPYLHKSCKPLSEVDFSTEEERGQLNMFNNECEGMCGV